MKINDTEITFNTRPKHGAVSAVRTLETMVLQQFIDVTTLDQNTDIQTLVMDMMKTNPKFKDAMMDMQASKHIDQTIMLSAEVDGKAITYQKLQELKAEMYEDEYLTLFEKSKEALGGKEAEDFFAIYRGGIDSRLVEKIMSRNRQQAPVKPKSSK